MKFKINFNAGCRCSETDLIIEVDEKDIKGLTENEIEKEYIVPAIMKNLDYIWSQVTYYKLNDNSKYLEKEDALKAAAKLLDSNQSVNIIKVEL